MTDASTTCVRVIIRDLDSGDGFGTSYQNISHHHQQSPSGQDLPARLYTYGFSAWTTLSCRIMHSLLTAFQRGKVKMPPIQDIPHILPPSSAMN